MRSLLRIGLSAGLGVVLLGAAAGGVQAAAFWVCGLSDDGTRLVCIADAEPAAASVSAAAPATAVVNGTRFPLDTRRQYTVELWSPPTEPDFVRQLAEATICYRSPGCQVSVAPGPWMATPSRLARR